MLTDEELMRRAVETARPQFQKSAPRWAAVKHVFCVGSTTAISLCQRCNLDPEERVVRRGVLL